MVDIFQQGDTKYYKYQVKENDVAKFESGLVHPVCSTYSLAREMEWSSRLFVLEMKEEHEEGIGTSLTINHRSPAGVGDQLDFIAEVASIDDHELICRIEVKCGNRLVAEGTTGQKVLSKDKIKKIFSSLK